MVFRLEFFRFILESAPESLTCMTQVYTSLQNTCGYQIQTRVPRFEFPSYVTDQGFRNKVDLANNEKSKKTKHDFGTLNISSSNSWTCFLSALLSILNQTVYHTFTFDLIMAFFWGMISPLAFQSEILVSEAKFTYFIWRSCKLASGNVSSFTWVGCPLTFLACLWHCSSAFKCDASGFLTTNTWQMHSIISHC